MADNLFITVEFSTKRIKTGILDSKGDIISFDQKELDLIYPRVGWVEQNPADFLSSAIITIKKCLKTSKIDPKAIKAIAISSQMAGILGIDKEWNPVTIYDSWLDTRCREYVDFLKGYQDLLIEKVGSPPAIAHGPKILWWKNRRKKIFDKIYKIIMPNCYVAGKMAELKGDDAFIDYTFLHFTGFCDALKQKWSDELCQLFEVPINIFPKIVDPWAVIGELSIDQAKKMGLIKGIPIIAGAGNYAASQLGAGIVKPGMILDIAGSASTFSCCVKEFVPDRRYKTFTFQRSVIPGLWHPSAHIAGGGLCIKWFISDLMQRDSKICNKSMFSKILKFLEKGCMNIPIGSENLFFVPHFRGRVSPYNMAVKGTWFGIDWKHKEFHFFRSILESLAYEYFYYMTTLKKIFPRIIFKEARVISDGANIELWNQIKADTLGIPYVKMEKIEVGLLGLMLIAGYYMRDHNDFIKTSSNIHKKINFIKPNIECTFEYKKLANKYLQVLSNIEYLFSKINVVETNS